MLKKLAAGVFLAMVVAAIAQQQCNPPSTASYARHLVQVIDGAGINARLEIDAGEVVLRGSELACKRLWKIVLDGADAPAGQHVRCIAPGTSSWEQTAR
jgi:hypothetical protein